MDRLVADAALHRLDSADSAMDLVHRLGESGAAAGTAVVAAEQRAGRGSRGRVWHSPRGGLWLALLARPSREGCALLSLRAGLAVAEALDSAGSRLRLKWPNDLMAGERKLGGILVEVRWAGPAPAWAAVGVGLNVRNPLPPELADTAARLTELDPDATPERTLEVVLPALRAADTAAPRLSATELGALARRDWLFGRALTAPLAGRGAGIAPDGSLLVRRADGALEALRSGTVELADRPDRR